MAAEQILFPLYGLTDLEQSKALSLDEGTVNFYPDGLGYLTNYPGRTDFFNRDIGDMTTTNITSSAPASGSANYTRVISFVDFLGIDHLVIVKDNQLLEVVGNGTKVLYTFTGLLESGKAYPEMFIHESKLIIVNEDDFPLVWDGVDGVHSLGVQETPAPPYINQCKPWAGLDTGHGEHTAIPTHALPSTFFNSGAANNGPYHWKQWWPFASAAHTLNTYPQSGCSLRETTGGTGITGLYSWCVQYFDKYGNKGRPSAPSAKAMIAERDANYKWDQAWPLVNWERIVNDPHVSGVIVGRTLCLNPKDSAPLGKPTTFFQEYVQNNVTQSRYTSGTADEVLAAGTLIDQFTTPPPNSITGTSFAGRIFLVDKDKADVKYSDAGYFGQFRSTNSFNAYSDVVSLVTSGDRLFVIGETSTEVLYSASTGITLLEQDIEHGSSFGRSFVSVGDGAIFGLWKKGFGYFDGVNHKFVNAPYYIEKEYMDSINFKHKAILVGDWYLLSIRKTDSAKSTHNNTILLYHTKMDAWYVLEDSLNDIYFWNDEILGVSGSLYVLFRGSQYPASRIKTTGFTPSSVSQQFTISDVKILMEPTSNSSYDIQIRGEERRNVDVGQGVAYPHKGAIGRRANAVMEPYWNNPRDDWDGGQEWQAPGDFWSDPRMDKPITGFQHRIDVTFAAAFPVKVKAFAATYSSPTRSEEK